MKCPKCGKDYQSMIEKCDCSKEIQRVLLEITADADGRLGWDTGRLQFAELCAVKGSLDLIQEEITQAMWVSIHKHEEEGDDE